MFWIQCYGGVNHLKTSVRSDCVRGISTERDGLLYDLCLESCEYGYLDFVIPGFNTKEAAYKIKSWIEGAIQDDDVYAMDDVYEYVEKNNVLDSEE